MRSLLLISLALAAMPARAQTPRPNIVLIVLDDLGYGELGCYGGTQIPTPHINSLAAAGVTCTSAYVTAPFCAASRAALLTGRYQTRFGFEFNPIGAANADPAIGLPAGLRTLPEVLRDAGYATALVGKWHLGGTARFHPQRRGFDEFFGFLHEGHYYRPPPWEGTVTWLRRNALPDGSQGRWTSSDGRLVWSTHMGNREPDYDADNPILRGSQPLDEPANLTDAFTREAESFIARHRQQPFFLCLAYNAVHSPLQAEDVYLERLAGIEDIHRRIFAAMLVQLDDCIGRLMARLRTEGLQERTLVLLLSDNGGPTRELTSSNHPLRGEKGQLYEGGIRVPLVMRWPGRLPAGKRDDRTVSSLDLFPTALAAAGVPVPAGLELDGVDLLPFLTGPRLDTPHETLYWRVGPQAALRQGTWKIYRNPRRGGSAAWQLYDLKQDIGEARDLAAEQPDKVRQLESAWRQLDEQMVEPLWGGRPAARTR
jgi:arylsulfatase B